MSQARTALTDLSVGDEAKAGEHSRRLTNADFEERSPIWNLTSCRLTHHLDTGVGSK
ncbi:MAG: hypothetical protein ACLSIR_05125 [Christensenellales bacterium]